MLSLCVLHISSLSLYPIPVSSQPSQQPACQPLRLPSPKLAFPLWLDSAMLYKCVRCLKTFSGSFFFGG